MKSPTFMIRIYSICPSCRPRITYFPDGRLWRFGTNRGEARSSVLIVLAPYQTTEHCGSILRTSICNECLSLFTSQVELNIIVNDSPSAVHNRATGAISTPERLCQPYSIRVGSKRRENLPPIVLFIIDPAHVVTTNRAERQPWGTVSALVPWIEGLAAGPRTLVSSAMSNRDAVASI